MSFFPSSQSRDSSLLNRTSTKSSIISTTSKRGVKLFREPSYKSTKHDSRYASIQVTLDPSIYLDFDELGSLPSPPPIRPLPQVPSQGLALTDSSKITSRANPAPGNLCLRRNSFSPSDSAASLPNLERIAGAETDLTSVPTVPETAAPPASPKVQPLRTSVLKSEVYVPGSIYTQKSNSAIRNSQGLSANARVKDIIQEKGIENLAIDKRNHLVVSSRSHHKSKLSDSSARSVQEMAISHLVNPHEPFQMKAESPDAHLPKEEPSRALPSIPAVIWYDDEVDWAKPRYTSGPIRTQPSFGLYTIPMMTALDVLYHTEFVPDDEVIDELVGFFRSYGFKPIRTNLDNYWTKNAQHITPSPSHLQSRLSPKSITSSPRNFASYSNSQASPDYSKSLSSNTSSKCSSPLSPIPPPSPPKITLSNSPSPAKRYSSPLSFLRKNGRQAASDSTTTNSNYATSVQSQSLPGPSKDSFRDTNHAEQPYNAATLSHRAATQAGTRSLALKLPPSSTSNYANGNDQIHSGTLHAASRETMNKAASAPLKARTFLLGHGAHSDPSSVPEAGGAGVRPGDWSPRFYQNGFTGEDDAGSIASGTSLVGSSALFSGFRKKDKPASITSSDKDSLGGKKESKLSLKKIFGKTDLTGLDAYDVYYQQR
jgi:hypothetical protein